MKEKILNNKVSYILYAIIMLIIVALMFGVSSAKYTDVIKAYTGYGIADFNAIILGDSSSGTIKAFDGDIIANNCDPGMAYTDDENNTAKLIPFSIANGITEENASETGLSYTLKLRTTRNIPLDFSLLKIVSDDEKVLYATDGPVLIEDSNEAGSSSITKNIWYEWTFYEADGEEGEKEEAVFTLTGGELTIDNFQLVVEWPITEGGAIQASDGSDGMVGIPDNSVDYMKEIDLIELFVTVSSNNSLDEEHEGYSYGLDDIYGKGIILLDPSTGIVGENAGEEDDAYTNRYSYLVDFRAFHAIDLNKYQFSPETPDIKNNAYEFEVNNGVGLGIDPDSTKTEYYFELKVPYTTALSDDETTLAEEDAVYATKDFTYKLYSYNSINKNYTLLTPSGAAEYRLYDVQYNSETYGKYKVITNMSAVEDGAEIVFAGSDVQFENLVTTSEEGAERDFLKEWSEEKSQYRLYKVYTYASQTMMNTDDKGAIKATFSRYCLVVDNDHWPSEEVSEKFGNMVFDNKVEIIVNAKFVTVEVDPEGSGEETEDPDENGGGDR